MFPGFDFGSSSGAGGFDPFSGSPSFDPTGGFGGGTLVDANGIPISIGDPTNPLYWPSIGFPGGTPTGPPGSGGAAPTPTSPTTSSATQQGIKAALKAMGLSDSAINGILTAAGIGGSIGSAAINAANRGQALTLLQQLSQGIQGQLPGAQFAGQFNLGPASAGSQAILSGQNPYMQLVANSLLPNIGQLNNLLPTLFGQNTATGQPASLAALKALSGSGSLFQPTADVANQITQNMGSTQWSLPGVAQGTSLMQGATPAQSTLGTAGQTMINAGGQNPLTQALGGAGTGLLATGGMTPELAAALASTQGIVNAGGVNPMIGSVFGLGSQLANPNPLLPMGLVASFAQDQAARNYANQAANMKAQLQARGQGPGAVVASGAGTSALADFADQALPGIQSAVQNALAGQQGLQLQQTGLGGNLMTTGSGQAMSNLANALAALSNLTNTATGRLQVGGGLTGSAQGLNLQGVGLGGNLLNSYLQSQLGGGSLLSNLLGVQNQTLGEGLNAGLGAAGGQQSALAQAMQALLTGSGQGIQQGTNLGNLYLGNQQALANSLFGGVGASQSAANSLAGMGGTWLQYANDLLKQLGGVTGQQAGILTTGSPWAGLLGNLGAIVPPTLPSLPGTSSTAPTGGSTPASTPTYGGAGNPVDVGGNFIGSGLFNPLPVDPGQLSLNRPPSIQRGSGGSVSYQ